MENCTINTLKDSPLFISRKHKTRITKGGVQYILRNLGKIANIADVHPHRFRRTFATDLLGRGMKIEEVMLLMGHSKLDTTMIYYDINQTSVESSFRKCA